jgi:hypothetical protein
MPSQCSITAKIGPRFLITQPIERDASQRFSLARSDKVTEMFTTQQRNNRVLPFR